MSEKQVEVQAAGGVLIGTDDRGRPAIAVVHRPRYDDWSLPKGKLDDGEAHEAAAIREVEEETGLRTELGRELPPVEYLDRKGRRKVVRYWVMRPLGGAFIANDEVDELRWLPVAEALDILSYAHDRELVQAFGAQG
ncbi:MAG: NUDIX hydrolase [Actinomycetota bacterium]